MAHALACCRVACTAQLLGQGRLEDDEQYMGLVDEALEPFTGTGARPIPSPLLLDVQTLMEHKARNLKVGD